MGIDLARHGVRTITTGAAAVTVTSWGLRGRRVAETAAEGVRLTAADVLAEARERVGEQAPPPGHDAAGHEH